MTITTLYRCLTCENKPEFSEPAKMFSHLREVHKLENPIKGMQTPRAFLDGSRFFSQVFDLNFDGIILSKFVTGEREKR